MPAMIRSNKKARKIAWGILGVPANIKYDKSAFSEKIEKRLNAQYTSRIKTM